MKSHNISNINVVLYEPEIPQNTGNIIRICAATDTTLHLIKPLGFSLEEKFLKRAAVDYYDKAKIFIYENYEDFLSKNDVKYIYFITRYGKNMYENINYKKNKKIYLVFGKESAGIPKKILQENINKCLRLPMNNKVRSLNLSNCVAVVIYEMLRQEGFSFLNVQEPENFKGKDYLLKLRNKNVKL